MDIHPILVFGLGLSGQAAANWLSLQKFKTLLVDDFIDKNALNVSILNSQEILEKKIRFSQLILSPGISRTHPLVQYAMQTDAEILNEMELAAKYLPQCQFIGVTGTNGKSSVTTLLGRIFKRHFGDDKVFVGGNIGEPLSQALLNNQKPEWAILELSSFQLETIRHLALTAAICTNLAPDHLDRYSSTEEYYAAKIKMLSLLKADGFCVVPAKDSTITHIFQTDKPLFSYDASSNLTQEKNLAACRVLCKNLGFDPMIQESDTQNLLAHRFEILGSKRDVTWINDSKATNVHAACSALKSVQKTHWIVGGICKESELSSLIEEAQGRVKHIYAIGRDAWRFMELFANIIPITHAQTLQIACTLAHANAHQGDTILLAPACASYDQFNNFVERGDEFKKFFKEMNAKK